MAILDEMVLHCCGDCRNGHGTSFIDYTLDGNNNPSQKNTEEDMRISIDSNTDLSLPVYGFSDQRRYMKHFRFVPIVESPGAAFIVARKEFGSESPIERLVYGFGPLLLFNVMTICLTGLLMWILVSSFGNLPMVLLMKKFRKMRVNILHSHINSHTLPTFPFRYPIVLTKKIC